MTKMTKYAPGAFSWVDLATTNVAAAKKFYSGLFGWQTVDMPIDDSSVYTMAQLGDDAVAGMSQLGEEQLGQGMPPVWTSYVTVASVDDNAAKAKSLGGALLLEPMDVLDVGRMAMVQDPTGATFAMWEPKAHQGAGVVNEPGALAWNELATRDIDKAGAFYTNLFGWETEVQEMPMTTYFTFTNGGRMNGGMMQMTEEWGDMPSHWMVYFAVADCDASASKVEALGGKIEVPPTDVPEVGRFSVVSDPQGVHFSIIKLENPD